GSLVAAAAAWSALSTEYTEVADELVALLAAVQGGAWEGPTAAEYVAAHAPFLAWLTQASVNSATAAAQHEIAAAAYTAALAAMPTLVELAANHAVHGVLVATNFFGINTIPIALNEADYVRMWVQAATTMASYEAVSGTAAASTPATSPAPEIVHTEDDHEGDEHEHEEGEHDEHEGHDHGDPTVFDYFLADLLRTLTNNQFDWDPLEGTVNGIPAHDYTDATQPIWWGVRAVEFSSQAQNFVSQLSTDPYGAMWFVIELALLDWPTHVLQVVQAATSPQLIAVALGAAVSNLGSVAGLAGLAGLAGTPPAAAVPAMLPPVAAVPLLPVAAVAPSVVASAAPAAPTPAPTPTASSVASTAPAPPPSAPAAGFGFPYLVGGGPGIGFGSGMAASASASRKASEPDLAAVAAAAAAREQARARRRRRGVLRDHGDEFADMNVDVDPDWGAPEDREPVASRAGAGRLGFAGAARKESGSAAAGLSTLVEDEFASGPTEPMLPSTWDPRRA
ncbi:PPE family protein, partial [Mycobacterium gordonae]